MILHHGTTLQRAQGILQRGPDCDYDEPNGGGRPEGFYAAPAQGPFTCGDPRSYAYRKAAGLRAANLSNEDGPAILEFEIPTALAEKIVGQIGELSGGKAFNAGDVICFEWGGGLEGLCDAWASLTKRVIPLEPE